MGVDGVSVSFPGITVYMTPFTINPLPKTHAMIASTVSREKALILQGLRLV